MTTTEGKLRQILDRICDPLASAEDWGLIMEFCAVTKNMMDGPKTAAAVILAKIRGHPANTALRALLVLDTCSKNSGRGFQDVIGKFKFLNELIKLVSRKYYSDTPDIVRRKILEIIQGWTMTLPDQPKIKEAYDMLKRQGQDFPLTATDGAPAVNAGSNFLKKEVKRMNSMEKDEKQAALASLLQSKHPADIAAANKLIKDLVLEDDHIHESTQKLNTDMTVVQNNVKILTEMLDNYDHSSGRIEDNELIQELRQSCTVMQPKLTSLANEMDSDDDIERILALNDSLNVVLRKYHDVADRFGRGRGGGYGNESASSGGGAAAASASGGDSNLIDLLAFDGPAASSSAKQTGASSLLDNELASMGLGGSTSTTNHNVNNNNNNNHSNMAGMAASSGVRSPPPTYEMSSGMGSGMMGTGGVATPASQKQQNVGGTGATNSVNPLDDLNGLNFGGPQYANTAANGVANPASPVNASAAPMSAPGSTGNLSNPMDSPAPVLSHGTGGGSGTGLSDDLLADVFVSPEDVKPRSMPPLNVMDEGGLNVMFYFCENQPAPGVLVIFATFLNSMPMAMKDFVFQAAVPKSLKLKLQTASAVELPGFNPLKGPAAVNQVMLIANPNKVPIKLRYKVTFTQNGESKEMKA
eukprot:Nk52_evm7s327 gene=Nk52_evmTU7s327